VDIVKELLEENLVDNHRDKVKDYIATCGRSKDKSDLIYKFDIFLFLLVVIIHFSFLLFFLLTGCWKSARAKLKKVREDRLN
jgi:hypothetical protein